MKLKKKFVLLVLLILFASIFTGCVQQKLDLIIKENGKANLEFSVQVDESMAGDETKMHMWGVLNAFPELRDNYELIKDTKSIDYTNYLIYTFKNKKPIDILENDSLNYKDGVFKMKIPKLIDDVSENSKDDLVYEIKITLPKEIDMANSKYTDGKTIIWKIYKEDLVSGMTLKAMTK